MKKLPILLILFLVSYALAQQPKVAVGLSPVPLWPASGDTSSLPKDQYVFYNSPGGEYVVSYPTNLSDPQSTRITQRFSSHALTDPQITTTITSLGNGQFEYSFTIGNGSLARTAIEKWRITMPAGAVVKPANAASLVTPPSGWQSTSSSFEASGTDMLLHGQHSLQTIEWTNQSEGIAKQGLSSGHAIQSALLPGFVTVSVQGHAERELGDQVRQSMPREVQAQVNQVQTATWDSQSRLVLGPRFAADASREEMAANFFQGISSLTRRSQLDRNSPFVQQALEVLNSNLQNNTATALTTDSMPFLSQASSNLERVIASAMEIGFRTK